MSGMRIAIATVGTTGDVRPFVALGLGLQGAGHDVHAVTWPVHVPAFEAAGLACSAAGPHSDPTRITDVAEAAAAVADPMRQVGVLRDFHLQDGATHLRRLRDLLAGYDLVVLHSIHALAHAAVMELGARWASAVFDPVLLPTREAPPLGMPSLGPFNRVLWSMLDRALAGTGRPLDDVLAAAGSPIRGLPLFRARSPLLHLVACSPSIVRVPRDLPRTTHVTGAWLPSGPVAPVPDDLGAFLDAGPAPAVITFGSMGVGAPGMVSEAAGMLAAAGHRVVVQGMEAVPPAGPGAVFAAGPVDHRALFPRASVIVHHGGAGTTHTAALAGVPQVLVPHVGDQRYWADRAFRLGIAPPAVPAAGGTADALVGAVIEAATSPSMRASATSLANHLRSEDGVTTAVARLLGVAPS